jgi:hypothetical protein
LNTNQAASIISEDDIMTHEKNIGKDYEGVVEIENGV